MKKLLIAKSLVLAAMSLTLQAAPTIALAESCFPKPVGCRMNSPFGNRFHPVHKKWKMHKGNDFACPAGTPILSPIDGSTTFSGVTTGGGNTVKVMKGQYEMVFMHNYRNIARVGDKVVVGQEIAKVGSTGYSTGPHLHFEIRQSGKHVDPQLLLCGGTPAPVAPPAGSDTPPAEGGGGGGTTGGGTTGPGAPADPGSPAYDGLEGSFWDILAGAVGSRALNPAYPYQLSTLDEARLFEELNYLEGINILVSFEKQQAFNRIMNQKAILQTIRIQSNSVKPLIESRKAAINSAGK